MKVKEAKVCAAFAWSPVPTAPGLIATGSIAGAMDDNFSADAHLEIRQVDMWDTTTQEMPVIAKTNMPDRVHRIDWSPHGGEHGIIAGGLVDGSVGIWSVDAVLRKKPVNEDPNSFDGLGGEDSDDQSLLCKIAAHTGGVKGCHFNTLTPYFLATGGQDRSFKVFSLQESGTPKEVDTGSKNTTLAAEVTDLRWNVKFGHILGTTTSAGTVHVWDLKAKRAALSFSVAQNNCPAANTLAWHPEVATHVAVARDDPSPVIQIWDLKKAMAPIRELHGHTGGILGLAWCQDDPSILMSVGRDGRTMCWNPQTGDLFGEMPRQENYIYDVKWAPKFPAVIATASFDSSLSVFGAQDVSGGSNVGGMNKSAPKWLCRSNCAAFGHGQIVTVNQAKKTVKIVDLPQDDSNHLIAKERSFCTTLSTVPVRSSEGAEWIKGQGWGIVGAAAESGAVGTKVPLLEFLGASPDVIDQKIARVCAEEEEDEETFSTGSQKPATKLTETEYTDLLSSCVVAGKVNSAVTLALAAEKFDDAFAVALHAGPEETQRVHEAYVQHKRGNFRFAEYLGVIKSKQFDSLASSVVTIPWKEILAFYSSWVPSQFAHTCNMLAEVLETRGDLEAAATCFVCAGNVDRAALLWKGQGKYDTQELVHVVTVLEQSMGKQCSVPEYAAALSEYSKILALHGEFNNAFHYASRAQQMGLQEAAITADKVQYRAASAQDHQRVQFPFAMDIVPDASNMACQMMESQQPHHVQPAVQQSVTGAGHHQQTSNFEQPATMAAPQVQARPTPQHADPNAQQSYSQQTRGQQPGGTQQAYPQTQPRPTAQPTAQKMPTSQVERGYAAPQGQPQPQPHAVNAHPQYQYPNAGQHPQVTAGQQPPNGLAAQQQTGPAPQPQMTKAMPVQKMPPPQTVVAPTAHKTVVQPPQEASPVTPAPKAQVVQPTMGATLPSRPVAPSGTGGGLASVKTDSVAPEYFTIVNGIKAAVERITDKRKRDGIEKAAAVLFNQLNDNRISPHVASLLTDYVNALGTPQKAECWRKLTDQHWDAIQPFLNIKFL